MLEMFTHPYYLKVVIYCSGYFFFPWAQGQGEEFRHVSHRKTMANSKDTFSQSSAQTGTVLLVSLTQSEFTIMELKWFPLFPCVDKDYTKAPSAFGSSFCWYSQGELSPPPFSMKIKIIVQTTIYKKM